MKKVSHTAVEQIVESSLPQPLSIKERPPIKDDHVSHLYSLVQWGQTTLASDHLLFPEINGKLSETVGGLIRKLNLLFLASRPVLNEPKEIYQHKVHLRQYSYEFMLEAALNFCGLESRWLDDKEKADSLSYILNTLQEWEDRERGEGGGSIAEAVISTEPHVKPARDWPLYLIGIVVALWTIIPTYHLLVIALTPQQEAVASGLFPKNPTLQNFELVLGAKHNMVQHFWSQLGASAFIAVMVAVITLVVGACANFAITRIRIRGGRTIPNIALLTYLIPAAFLAIPMYKTMGAYRLVDSPWSLIFAMVALASPYAIWVMNQASTKIPRELDEAAKIDGASTMQIFRFVYLPLMVPTMVAIGTYALLLAWNEYLYAFLMLATESRVTLSVALGNFLAFDDAPWALLMATGVIYALPPTAIYYAFRRYMVSGLTAGAVKS